jgi:aspartyl-tRNA synthetase
LTDQTLPIGYYPTLADESLDKILLDQNPSHVEFMITPANLAKDLDIGSIAESSQVVSAPLLYSTGVDRTNV